VTITLPLQPQEEARLIALARSKGLSPEALVREALDKILTGASEPLDPLQPERTTGAALVAAMESSPYRETDLETARGRFPVRDVTF